MTTYILIGGLVAAAIFFLLWRLAVSKKKQVQLELDFAKARIEGLKRISVLEHEIWAGVLSGVEREAAEKEIREINKRVLQAKVGDKIPDIFGSEDG